MQSLDEQLAPVITEIAEEFEGMKQPCTAEEYEEVIDSWMESIREVIVAATTEFNTDYKTG
jgi:CO dehydrogenase/acetyl-CoA synthase epsilon subunit